jgi:hypothetical protein
MKLNIKFLLLLFPFFALVWVKSTPSSSKAKALGLRAIFSPVPLG